MCNIAESQLIRHSYKMSKIIQSIFFHQGPLKPAIRRLRRGPLFSSFILSINPMVRKRTFPFQYFYPARLKSRVRFSDGQTGFRIAARVVCECFEFFPVSGHSGSYYISTAYQDHKINVLPSMIDNRSYIRSSLGVHLSD